MTIKERFESLEARMQEKDEEIDQLCAMVNSLRKKLYCNEDQICEIWECILEEDIPEEEEEDKMTRTSLCDVYADCEACPECDVCFDVVIDEDTEQLLDDGCDISDSCEECPLEEQCSMQCEAYMQKFREGL